MYTNNIEQLIKFGYFIIVGVSLSIVFDIFRISRKTIKTSDIITNIEDILFGIITGIIILFSIFIFNNGELRLYIFLGIAVGIIIYMIFISKYFIRLNMYIINLIKTIFVFITKPFIFIFRILKKVIFRPISFIFINIRKSFLKKKKKISKKKSNKKDFNIFCRK